MKNYNIVIHTALQSVGGGGGIGNKVVVAKVAVHTAQSTSNA